MNNELIKVINDKEYHFKFKSKKCIDLEKATGKQSWGPESSKGYILPPSLAKYKLILNLFCIFGENS